MRFALVNGNDSRLLLGRFGVAAAFAFASLLLLMLLLLRLLLLLIFVGDVVVDKGKAVYCYVVFLQRHGYVTRHQSGKFFYRQGGAGRFSLVGAAVILPSEAVVEPVSLPFAKDDHQFVFLVFSNVFCFNGQSSRVADQAAVG